MEFFNKFAGNDLSQSKDDPEMFIYAEVPDVVRVPPEAGGGVCKVRAAFIATCPHCGSRARHLELGEGLRVAECSAEQQFFWYHIDTELEAELELLRRADKSR